MRSPTALLTRMERADPWRAAWALSAAAWVPLALIAVIERVARGEVEPMLRDPAVHVRLLIAVPAFLMAQLQLTRRSTAVLGRLADEQMAERRGLERVAAAGERIAGSMITGLLLLVLAVAVSQAQLRSWIAPPLLGTHLEHGPASIWYAWIALPIFLFAGGHFLLRWLLWTAALFRISRMRLSTDPAHPDRCAGLSLLVAPVDALSIFALGLGVVACAAWGNQIALGHARLGDFRVAFGVLAGTQLLLAFVPLFAFSSHLRRSRRRGLDDYGALGMDYVRRFRARWIDRPPGPELLGTSDLQSLADLGNSFQSIRRMRPIPLETRELVTLTIAIVAPLVPLILTQVPLATVVPKLLKTLLAG